MSKLTTALPPGKDHVKVVRDTLAAHIAGPEKAIDAQSRRATSEPNSGDLAANMRVKRV
jgi:hypothetical protein